MNFTDNVVSLCSSSPTKELLLLSQIANHLSDVSAAMQFANPNSFKLCKLLQQVSTSVRHHKYDNKNNSFAKEIKTKKLPKS